ncbi:MAG: hypothetical protein BGN88_14330 [Clostridiales bacterium 43-6]|nr:MAG: hypothetical protein BGN88_14330 [Clostridiales bacterium 43-6]
MAQSKSKKLPGLGMRTIKTSVSVMLCIVFFEQIDLNTLFHVPSSGLKIWAPFYACTAAIICLQGTTMKSLKMGIVRLIGTAIGGVTGVLILLSEEYVKTQQYNVLVVGVGIVICIFVSNITKKQDASAIACVVFVAIMINHNTEDRYIYAVMRMIETTIGIIIAVVVNKFLNVPSFFKK